MVSTPAAKPPRPEREARVNAAIAHMLGGRSPSTGMVVLMLLGAGLLQSAITMSLEHSVIAKSAPPVAGSPLATLWLGLRLAVVVVAIVLWASNRPRPLFQAILVATIVLTLGLALNMAALILSLAGISANGAGTLLTDAVTIAMINILLFASWYWIIDPPGIDETKRVNEPWDFLFPQRASDLPHFENWEPRATDYLFLAFTTTFAFSPTDTLPLSRRAKYLMMLQAVISVICISAILGRAINILA